MLYLSWTGTDDPHHLNLLSSQDGQTFSGKVILNTAAYQQQGVNPPHDLISPAGPALLTNYLRGQGDAGQGGGDPWLILAWTGYDGGRLWSTHFDRPNLGVGLASPVVHYTDTSGVAPALGQLGNDADYPFIAWAGTGNEQLNVALTSDLPSTG